MDECVYCFFNQNLVAVPCSFVDGIYPDFSKAKIIKDNVGNLSEYGLFEDITNGYVLLEDTWDGFQYVGNDISLKETIKHLSIFADLGILNES